MSLSLTGLAKRLSLRPLRPARRAKPLPAALRCETLEDRTVPTATVTVAAAADAVEGGADGLFRFTRTGDTSQPLTVRLALSGTAVLGPDYDSYAASITFAAGSATAESVVHAYDDAHTEPDETVVLTIQPGFPYATPYIIGTPGTATVLILENDNPPPPFIGQGTGLFGRYYNAPDLTDVKATRTDDRIDRNWGYGVPIGGVGTDHFSVRWTGKVMPKYTGVWTFITTSDDGVRLWVNGQLIIDKWIDQSPTPWPGAITLTGGQTYDITLEYYEKTLNSQVRLAWKHALQTEEVIPQSQLYPNVSTVGDRVWLDTNGNGLQDAGESGQGGVPVRIYEGSTLVDALPPTTTDASGNYSFPQVPAGGSFRLHFGGGGGQDVNTQQVAGNPATDSDADPATGLTADFTALPAGQTDSTRDGGVLMVFDLDVNADGDLADPVDGAANYLPGYEGDTPKVSIGSTFNSDSYQRQRMKLILDGIGSATPNISRVVFELVVPETTSYAGYTSNRSHTSVEAGGAQADYSFLPNQDYFADPANPPIPVATVTPASVEQLVDGLPVGGQMQERRTWINLYCKDYGGATQAKVRVYRTAAGGGEVLDRELLLDVPKDTDNDNLADKWEVAMAARWAAQYGLPPETPAQALGRYNLKGNENQDDEPKDPDGPRPAPDRLVEQKEVGDAHTIKEEYRGYILDGGGYNGQGTNGHNGGHIRLDPARKEVLLEVDRGAVLNNIPNNDLPGMLNGATKVFSNADRGAGIYVYWLIDDAALNLPDDDVDEVTEHPAKLQTHQNQTLKNDFLHILLFDTGVSEAITRFTGMPSITATVTYGRVPTHPMGSYPVPQRGVVFATTDASVGYNAADYPKTAEAYSCALAHEITHLLITKFDGGFNTGEHTTNPNTDDGPDGPLDQVCLMFKTTSRANREFATAKFFPVVLAEIRTQNTEGWVF